MKELTVNNKINIIKKYYKKKPIFLELILMNYEKTDFYICINEIEENEVYRLSWFDLNDLNDKNVYKHLSCQYIPSYLIDMIIEEFKNQKVNTNYKDKDNKDEYKVILDANIKTKDSDNINIFFNRYLPEELFYLTDLFIFIFRYMPAKYEIILKQILAVLTDDKEKYEYYDEIEINILKDDLSNLFAPKIIKRGINYYKENKIKYLEKINDIYYSIINQDKEYLTMIHYDEEKEKTKLFCSCLYPGYCKHLYAQILSIKNNKYYKFYKIIYISENIDILDSIVNSNYFLCFGIEGDYLKIINEYYEKENVKILDNENKCNWKILEDDENKTLTKKLNKYLKESGEEYK